MLFVDKKAVGVIEAKREKEGRGSPPMKCKPRDAAAFNRQNENDADSFLFTFRRILSQCIIYKLAIFGLIVKNE